MIDWESRCHSSQGCLGLFERSPGTADPRPRLHTKSKIIRPYDSRIEGGCSPAPIFLLILPIDAVIAADVGRRRLNLLVAMRDRPNQERHTNQPAAAWPIASIKSKAVAS
jgi:hypothetical protein